MRTFAQQRASAELFPEAPVSARPAPQPLGRDLPPPHPLPPLVPLRLAAPGAAHAGACRQVPGVLQQVQDLSQHRDIGPAARGRTGRSLHSVQLWAGDQRAAPHSSTPTPGRWVNLGTLRGQVPTVWLGGGAFLVAVFRFRPMSGPRVAQVARSGQERARDELKGVPLIPNNTLDDDVIEERTVRSVLSGGR